MCVTAASRRSHIWTENEPLDQRRPGGYGLVLKVDLGSSYCRLGGLIFVAKKVAPSPLFVDK